MSRKGWLGLVVVVAWAVAYAVTGRLSDDGLHAYAGQALLRGQRLYTDFEYHQAPLLPYLLAAWYRLVGVGLLQARVFAGLVSLGVVGAMLSLARRLGAGREALGWMLLAAAASPSLLLHLGYVQSQGLATLLTLGACLAALRGGGWLAAAWVLAGLAAGARVSFVTLLLPLGWYTAVRGRAWLVPGAALWALVVAAVFAPHYRAGDIQHMLFLPFGGGGNALTAAYAELYLGAAEPWSWLTKRVGGWPNQVVYYAPLWLLLVVAGRQRGPRHADRDLAVLTALVLTLVHGVLPQRVNHSYLVVAMPLWAAVAGAWIGPDRLRPVRWRLAVLLALVACGVAVGRGVGRLDRSGGRTVLAEVSEVTAAVAASTPPGETVLTFAAEFVVDRRVTVTPGFECGYFAYFPNLTDADAARCHLVNERVLRDLLARRQPGVLLLHDGAFEPLQRTRYAWPDPDPLRALVTAGYEPVRRWERVGEKRTGLTLYRRRQAPPHRPAPATPSE